MLFIDRLGLKQIDEAKARLKILVEQGLLPNVKDEFQRDGTVYYSFYSILYWLRSGNNCDKLVEAVEQFERKYNALCYHAIHNHTEIGEMLSILYVSRHDEEWVSDREDLINGFPIVYVDNLDDPLCSEFGSIGIKTCNGGIIRTA